MILIPMMMLDVLQELAVVHDHKDDVRWYGSAKMFP